MLSFGKIMDDALWVAKMQGWRECGTYDEIGHLAKDEDCRDFGLAARQPEHLREFFDGYFSHMAKHGAILMRDYYDRFYRMGVAA